MAGNFFDYLSGSNGANQNLVGGAPSSPWGQFLNAGVRGMMSPGAQYAMGALGMSGMPTLGNKPASAAPATPQPTGMASPGAAAAVKSGGVSAAPQMLEGLLPGGVAGKPMADGIGAGLSHF